MTSADFPSGAATKRAPRLLRRFARDAAGATAVEFAMISVPFFGLLFAILETGFVYLQQQALQTAVTTAARKVMTGAAQGNAAVSTWQGFRDTYLCPSTGTAVLPSMITCSNVLVDVRAYTTFTSLTAANANGSFATGTPTYQPGCQNQIVIVRAAYPMPLYLPIITQVSWASLGGGVQKNTTGQTNYQGTMVHMLVGSAAFKNEPFPAPGGC